MALADKKLATVLRVLPPKAKHAQVQQAELPLNPRGKHMLLSFWITGVVLRVAA